MSEEKEDPVARNKRLQHIRYRRWYLKHGKAYAQKRKEQKALGPDIDVVRITAEPETK